MSDTDPGGQHAPLTEKRSDLTDAPRTPTETDTVNSANGRANTASLTGDLIQARNFQRSSKDLPGVRVAKNRKDATLSRRELLKFGEDAGIDLPKFWARVA